MDGRSLRPTKSRTSIFSRHSRSPIALNDLVLTDLDKGIIGWESQDDPAMPLNFSRRRKWGLLALVSFLTFIASFASSVFAPGVKYMDLEFGNTNTVLSTLSITIFVMGMSSGNPFGSLLTFDVKDLRLGLCFSGLYQRSLVVALF